MGKVKMTVSVPQHLASYLRSKANASSVVEEAVESYRVRELEAKLEEAYREDAREADRLNRAWETIDSPVEGSVEE